MPLDLWNFLLIDNRYINMPGLKGANIDGEMFPDAVESLKTYAKFMGYTRANTAHFKMSWPAATQWGMDPYNHDDLLEYLLSLYSTNSNMELNTNIGFDDLF